MFTKSTEYSIRAIIFLAVYASPEKYFGVSYIAKKLGFPEAFLGKVMQNIVKKGLVVSIKGPGGGFYVADSTCDYTILDIVEKLEGLDILSRCGLGLHSCDDGNPCPIHDEYRSVVSSISEALSSKSIRTIKSEILSGTTSMQFAFY